MYLQKRLDNIHPRVLFYRHSRLKSIREIAHCTQLVAMSILHKLKKKLDKRNAHFYFIKELFRTKTKKYYHHSIENELKNTETVYSYKEDCFVDVTNYAVIYITSDRQSTGLINSIVLSYTRDLLSDIVDHQKTFKLVSIGKKGYKALIRQYRTNFFRAFFGFEKERPSLFLAYIIHSQLRKATFDKCFIVFNRFRNLFLQIPTYYEFYSYDFFYNKIISNSPKNKLYNTLLKKNKIDDYYLDDLYSFCISLIILDALKETYYCEVACKAQVMETIVANVDELINHYWI